MKKVLLGLLFTAFGFAATAQPFSPVEGQKGYILAPTPQLTKKNTQVLSKAVGDTVRTWYNWIDTARNFATFSGYNNSFMFPDTMVKQLYGSVGGGTELGYVKLHSVGQIFDPYSSYYNEKSAMLGGYRLDSIAIAYGYKYHVPGSVDTLIVQFYKDAAAPNAGGIRRNTLQGSGEKTAFIAYDAKRNLGANAVKEVKILLTEADTSTAFRYLTVAVPDGGLDIAKAGASTATTAQGLSGFTVTYKPGYSYQLGDTLDSKWDNPVPTKLLNNFRILVQQDKDKTNNDNSYNNGVRLTSPVRYGLPSAGGWANLFIPGDAWNGYTEHIASLFHITYVEMAKENGVEEINAKNGYVLGNIFPNPTEGNATLEFTLPKTENVNVKIYNTMGQLVNTVANGTYASGKHTVKIDGENMKPGVYFYTIQAGNFVQTKGFSVVK